MDFERIEKAIGEELKSIFFSRQAAGIDPKAPDPRTERLKRLRGLVQKRRVVVARRQAGEYKRWMSVEQRRGALALARAGLTFMAFDFERSLSGLTVECGVTLFQRGGSPEMRSWNYLLHGAVRRSAFDFGPTFVMEEDEIHWALLAHAMSADIYVGHSLREDFRHLEDRGIALPLLPYFDTALMTRRDTEEAPQSLHIKLVEACELYGVSAPHPHCGGNDARYTMEVLLRAAAY